MHLKPSGGSIQGAEEDEHDETLGAHKADRGTPSNGLADVGPHTWYSKTRFSYAHNAWEPRVAFHYRGCTTPRDLGNGTRRRRWFTASLEGKES